MKQSDWPVYACVICGQTISAPSVRYSPSCEHVGTSHDAHRPTVMQMIVDTTDK